MTRWRLVPLVLALAAPGLPAVTTTVWETATEEDFQAGTLERVALSSQGRVRLGHDLTARRVEAAAVWSVLSAGGKVWLGTGNQGRVYVVEGGETRLALQTEEILVTSLAAGADGSIYAGTVPGGKIYRIAPDGRATTFAKLPDPYVWSLLAAGDSLYAATGPEGIVYHVDAEGRSTVHYDSTEKNVLDLAAGPEGSIFAGTDPSGLVLRIDGRGEASVLADLEQTEVRGLAYSGGRVYAAANKSAGFENAKMVDTLAKQITREKSGQAVERETLMAELLGGALIEIEDDGRIEVLYAAEKTFLTDVAVDGQGAVFVATGLAGRVLQIHDARDHVTRHEVKEGQVLALGLADGVLEYLGASSGTLYELSPAPAEQGLYTSAVHDAGFLSRWGVSSWEGTRGLRVRLKVGNTPSPDATWTEWSAWTADSPFSFDLPAARYVQYQVSWAEAPGGVLHAVRIVYVQSNQRPRITEYSLGKVAGGTRSLRKEKAESKLTIEWKAEDPNGDALLYHLYYREETRERWQRINVHEPIVETKYEWDTATIPDGRYLVRLVASDAPDNVEIEVLEGEWVSRPLLVDNRKPLVSGLVVDGSRRVRGTATDEFSPIVRIEWSLDGIHWRLVQPVDRIYDETSEEFDFELPPLEAGSWALSVRVTDAAANAGLVREVFEIE